LVVGKKDDIVGLFLLVVVMGTGQEDKALELFGYKGKGLR
jgi:hypothetical protein